LTEGRIDEPFHPGKHRHDTLVVETHLLVSRFLLPSDFTDDVAPHCANAIEVMTAQHRKPGPLQLLDTLGAGITSAMTNDFIKCAIELRVRRNEEKKN